MFSLLKAMGELGVEPKLKLILG